MSSSAGNNLGRRKTDIQTRWDRIMEWAGWRPLGALAAAILAGSILFGAFTLAQHTAALNTQNTYLHCIKQDFNQALGEAFRHEHIKPPPTC